MQPPRSPPPPLRLCLSLSDAPSLRLSTQFADIRSAFRMFDKDHSGNISAEECTDALLSLNVGVPRKWIDHLVHLCKASNLPRFLIEPSSLPPRVLLEPSSNPPRSFS